MSDSNQNAQNIRYPFLYKISMFLNDYSFYLFAIGALGVVISLFGLISKSNGIFFFFLSLVGLHLLSLTGAMVLIAINPKEYFIPIVERERKKTVRDGAVFFSGFTLFVALFLFVQNYTELVNGYFCVLVMTILVDVFCVFHYVIYGNGTRKIKPY